MLAGFLGEVKERATEEVSPPLYTHTPHCHCTTPTTAGHPECIGTDRRERAQDTQTSGSDGLIGEMVVEWFVIVCAVDFECADWPPFALEWLATNGGGVSAM